MAVVTTIVIAIIRQKVNSSSTNDFHGTPDQNVKSRNLQKEDSVILDVGREDSSDLRIINGDNAEFGRYPWNARLLGTRSCGGSLIARDLIITAAHCGTTTAITRAEVNRYDATTTTTTSSEAGNTAPIRQIVSYHPHPQWNGIIPNYDIMIVKLRRPFDDAIYEPVRLNFNSSIPGTTGEPLTMLGYGSVIPPSQGYEAPDFLQEAPTQYVQFNDCAVASNPESGVSFGNSPADTDVGPDWLCTLQTDPVRYATCFGDSGSPIFIKGDNPTEDILVGSTSG